MILMHILVNPHVQIWKLLGNLFKIFSIQSLEQVKIDNQIDIFGYTPTIKTGISINTDHLY